MTARLPPPCAWLAVLPCTRHILERGGVGVPPANTSNYQTLLNFNAMLSYKTDSPGNFGFVSCWQPPRRGAPAGTARID